VGGVRGQANVTVDFVQDTDVELTELGSRCDGGKEGPGGVAGSHVVRTEAGLIPREVVREVSSYESTRGDADASGGGELGHVEDVEGPGGDDAASGVFHAEIGSLVGLEGHFAPLAWDEGGLQYGRAVGFVLHFVEVETGVGELTPDFGGEGSGGGAVGLDGDGDGAGLALAF